MEKGLDYNLSCVCMYMCTQRVIMYRSWIKTGYVCVNTYTCTICRGWIKRHTSSYIYAQWYRYIRNSYIIPFNFFHLFTLSLIHRSHRRDKVGW